MNLDPPRIYGLIGYPVKHSFSPKMYNAAFQALRINAEYRLFEVKPEKLEDFFLEDITVKDVQGNDVRTKDIYGFNVTIPYKEKVLKYLNGYKSFGVKNIGAVNTVIKYKNGKLGGFNTDYLGFSRHLLELKLRPKTVAVIGAGGAAKAVCYTLAKKGTGKIFIYDIDKDKSVGLVDRFKGLFPKCKFLVVDSIGDLEIREKDLLINASPVGMKEEESCLVQASMLHPGLFVYDLIYNPPETKLLKLAIQIKLNFSNGLKMLFYQAIIPFRKWTDRTAPQKIMWQALQEELKNARYAN